MMQVAVVSDTHGFIHPKIARKIENCDFAIHAGDVVDPAVLEKIKPRRKTIAVAGNNDYHLPGLRDFETLEVPGGRVAILHGHQYGREPAHPSLREHYRDFRMIVYGHTHRQVVDQSAVPWVVNPGAAGVTRNQGAAKCLILKIFSEHHWAVEKFVFADN